MPLSKIYLGTSDFLKAFDNDDVPTNNGNDVIEYDPRRYEVVNYCERRTRRCIFTPKE